MNIAEELDQIEKKFSTVKWSYEQYFLGLGTVKIEPARERDEIQRKIAILTNTVINNTSLKFRFQSFVSKFNSYSVLWSRQARLKDEGKLFAAHKQPSQPEQEEVPAKPADENQEEEVKPPPHIWTDEKINRLLNRVNEVSAEIKNKPYSKDQIQNFVEKSITDIKSKYNKDVVDFTVVVRDGKVKVVPVLKQ